jgi:hypothetical protein
LYTFTEDNHLEEFKHFTKELITKNMVVNERIDRSNILISSYINVIGKRPPKKYLEYLSNFILKDHLESKNPDKLSSESYPFLSERQQKTREGKEFSSEDAVLDFIKLNHK